jgi:hypothetical protein
MIRGTLSLNVSLSMFVENGQEEEQIIRSCLTGIENSLHNISKNRNSYPEVGTYTTRVGQPNFTIIATFYGLKRTQEKNGAT